MFGVLWRLSVYMYVLCIQMYVNVSVVTQDQSNQGFDQGKMMISLSYKALWGIMSVLKEDKTMGCVNSFVSEKILRNLAS